MTDERLKEMEQEEEAIKLYEALKRLDANKDFKMLVREKYLRDSVLDNFSLLAHPAIKKNGERPDVMEEMVAKSNFNLFLLNIEQTGKYLTEQDNAEEVPEITED